MLVIVGTNHKYSSVELRERLTFPKRRLKEALDFLKERSILKAAVILSTCNRVEIYASALDTHSASEEIEDFIARYQEMEKKRFHPYLYRYTDEEALRHLLLVSCGLDSLILGETQILGQVRFAFFVAKDAGFVDRLLNTVFSAAIHFACRMHRTTQISQGKVSVGSVAIDFIKERMGSLSGKNILLIGVGKVTRLVLQYLRKENPNVVFVANRTLAKARELSAQIGARAVRFVQLKQFLKQADVVISATASPHFVIKKEVLQKAFHHERRTTNHELLIIDLALPRDVQPEVGEIKGVELFCLEDLQTVIERNKEKRLAEARKVEEMVGREVMKLWPEVIRWAPEPALLL